MTSIFYPDCSAVSASSDWKATAVSPHNGSILRRDRTNPEGDFAYQYREHQSDFRYRLESKDGSIIWERWQASNEDSPHELVVADDGTVVARTHGFRPELLVIGRDGQIAMRVALVQTDTPRDRESEDVDSEVVYVDSMQCSTAGNFWTRHSWPYYLTAPQGLLFVWRTCTGQRIVIDPLNRALIPTNGAEYNRISDVLDTTERQDSFDLLSRVSAKKELFAHLLRNPEYRDQLDSVTLDQISKVSAAILISGVGCNRKAIPLLKNFEDLDWPAYSTSTTAMRDYWIEPQYLRPLIQHSLRLMDEVPAGFPCYYFIDDDDRRLPVENRTERRTAELGKLCPQMNANDVLNSVGTPDYVHRYSVKNGRFYVWPENWEYDEFDGQNWFTTVLRWEEGKASSPLVSVEKINALWKQSSARLKDILQH